MKTEIINWRRYCPACTLVGLPISMSKSRRLASPSTQRKYISQALRFGDADNFVDSELSLLLKRGSGGNFIATFNFVIAP